jgi:asparagine synthase (glutamine-hydrolysing)
MCGIVGIVNSNAQPVDEAALRRMCDAIIHRGPDDEGYYLNAPLESGSGSPIQGGPVAGLGMRRLAIIDLNTGHQPIHNEDGTVWVVLNGEIYNYTELRADLEARGHRFYTHSDTEAIVHAYEAYGSDTPKHLHGMFAFAIWDEPRQRLLLARDRVGKKPLLYATIGGNLVFASEFQAMLRHPDVSREVNPEALSDYLSFMCVPAPQTAFRGIRKLEPGHTLVWQNGDVKIERYWSLDFKTKLDISEDEAGQRALELLRQAVRVRLISDVPLGAFLSGGIDSSAVVALMSELATGQVKTFSIGFDEQDFSELEHARRIAKRFATDHHEFVVRPDAVEVLPTLVRHYGEPYADSSAIPTYYLSKMTRRHVTVALNGDGGDECFAGYERYAAMRVANRYHRLPQFVRKQIVEPALGAIPEAGASRSRFGKARRFVSVMGRPADERYLRWTSAINDELKLELCTRDFLAQTAAALRHVAPWFAGNGGSDVVDRALMADTLNYLPNDLLVKVDIAGMAVSLEARSPFLDHRLMEFAASLPARFKLRGLTTKHLLKRVLRGLLPAENLTRRKMGFGVPISHWLRNELKSFLVETVLSERALRRGYFKPAVVRQLVAQHTEGKRDYSHQLWTLLMLELWHQEFIDK